MAGVLLAGGGWRHWLQKSPWTPFEAVCLIHGLDPAISRFQTAGPEPYGLVGLVYPMGRVKQHPQTTLALLERAIDTGRILSTLGNNGTRYVEPAALVEWARRTGIELAPYLAEAFPVQTEVPDAQYDASPGQSGLNAFQLRVLDDCLEDAQTGRLREALAVVPGGPAALRRFEGMASEVASSAIRAGIVNPLELLRILRGDGGACANYYDMVAAVVAAVGPSETEVLLRLLRDERAHLGTPMPPRAVQYPWQAEPGYVSSRDESNRKQAPAAAAESDSRLSRLLEALATSPKSLNPARELIGSREHGNVDDDVSVALEPGGLGSPGSAELASRAGQVAVSGGMEEIARPGGAAHVTKRSPAIDGADARGSAGHAGASNVSPYQADLAQSVLGAGPAAPPEVPGLRKGELDGGAAVPIDLLILTALTEEAQVVAAVLEKVAKTIDGPGSMRLYDYMVSHGVVARVATASAHLMGGVAIGVFATTLLQQHRPTSAVLVGIAAAVDVAQVHLGDVPFASQVFGYDDVAVEKGALSVRAQGFQVDPAMLAAVGEMRTDSSTYNAWRDECRTIIAEVVSVLNKLRREQIKPPQPDPGPHIVVDVVAGGPFLIRDAGFRDSLRKKPANIPKNKSIQMVSPVHPKVVSAEMEAHGFMAAAHQLQVPASVMKGISDDGDEGKRELERQTGGFFRAYACSNATLAALHVLRARLSLKNTTAGTGTARAVPNVVGLSANRNLQEHIGPATAAPTAPVAATPGIQPARKPNRASGTHNHTQDAAVRDRKRDVKALKRVAAHLPCSVLTDHFDAAQYGQIGSSALYFWEGFHATVTAFGFGLYDQDLDQRVRVFHAAWSKMLSHGAWFIQRQSGSGSVLQGPGTGLDAKVAAHQRQVFTSEADAAANAFRELVNFIQEHYRELDLDQLSRQAVKKYREFMAK